MIRYIFSQVGDVMDVGNWNCGAGDRMRGGGSNSNDVRGDVFGIWGNN